ncbi:MAG: hypothetical protein ACTSU5_02110 [Promethearchaeota archaeon]
MVISASVPTRGGVDRVTHNGVGDARAFPTLVERAVLECSVAEVLADGAYDTRDNFNLLQGLGIEPRSNASTRSRGCPSRSRGCPSRSRVVHDGDR